MANWYRDEATRRWPGATIQGGPGLFAVHSNCPPVETVVLYGTREEADRAKARIDEGGCYQPTQAQHLVAELAAKGRIIQTRQDDCCQGPVGHKVVDLRAPE